MLVNLKEKHSPYFQTKDVLVCITVEEYPCFRTKKNQYECLARSSYLFLSHLRSISIQFPHTGMEQKVTSRWKSSPIIEKGGKSDPGLIGNKEQTGKKEPGTARWGPDPEAKSHKVDKVPGWAGECWLYPGPLVWFWSDIQSGVREITWTFPNF